MVAASTSEGALVVVATLVTNRRGRPTGCGCCESTALCGLRGVSMRVTRLPGRAEGECRGAASAEKREAAAAHGL